MRLFQFLILAILLTSCTKQRDLYIENSPLFVVKADWSESTLSPHGATALVFNEQRAVLNNPYMQPPTATQPQRVTPDRYNILLFNNLMFSPTDNEFANIIFQNTDRFETFEAVARENAQVNEVFRSSADEMFIHNTDIIAAATYRDKVIAEGLEYVMKYKDGIRTGNYEGGYLNDEVELTPVRLTRNVQVVLRVKGYKPAFALYGTLRGFAQGVNLSTRKPTGGKATHAGFAINRAIEADDCYILTSDVFTSFGMWWDDKPQSNIYTLDVLARYKGQSDVFAYSFDVSECVEVAAQAIKSEEELYRTVGTVPKMDTIIIEVTLTLPDVIGDDEGLDVGVEDWGEVVIIPVPMTQITNN